MHLLALLVVLVCFVYLLWLETLLTEIDVLFGLIDSQDFHILTLANFEQLVDRSDTLVSSLSQLDESLDVSILKELHIGSKLHDLSGDDSCDISGLGHWIPVESEFAVYWVDLV